MAFDKTKFFDNMNAMTSDQTFKVKLRFGTMIAYAASVIRNTFSTYAIVTAATVTEFDDAAFIEDSVILYKRIPENDPSDDSVVHVNFIEVMRLGGPVTKDDEWIIGDLEERE